MMTSQSQPGYDECSLASADAEPSALLSDRPARLIVCGGRDYANYGRVCEVLDRLAAIRPIEMVFHGNARGADALADRWCRERGVRVFPVPAQWSKHGRRAGPLRNQAMLGHGIDLVVAFPGGAGTEDMVKRARRAGVMVTRALDAPGCRPPLQNAAPPADAAKPSYPGGLREAQSSNPNPSRKEN